MLGVIKTGFKLKIHAYSYYYKKRGFFNSHQIVNLKFEIYNQVIILFFFSILNITITKYVRLSVNTAYNPINLLNK